MIMTTKITKLLLLAAFFIFCQRLFAQNGQVNVDQPKAIEQLLEYKKDLSTIEVFKIQIFQSNDSFETEKAKVNFTNIYDEWPVTTEFNTPNYKIWVGNFRNRLEADRALLRIKKNYMNAFIFQPKED